MLFINYQCCFITSVSMWGLALSGGPKGFFLDVCMSDVIAKTVLALPMIVPSSGKQYSTQSLNLFSCTCHTDDKTLPFMT